MAILLSPGRVCRETLHDRTRGEREQALDEGEERPGKLGLHLAEGKDGWRIVAVLFSYDAA